MSCSEDDDDDDVKVKPKSLVGYWQCTYQKWEEDGDVEETTYNDAEGQYYYICFEEGFTGYMNSGRDELMELGGNYSFSWTVSGNKIVAEINYREDWIAEWRVNAISNNTLELYWKDDDYNITCKFKKIQQE